MVKRKAMHLIQWQPLSHFFTSFSFIYLIGVFLFFYFFWNVSNSIQSKMEIPKWWKPIYYKKWINLYFKKMQLQCQRENNNKSKNYRKINYKKEKLQKHHQQKAFLLRWTFCVKMKQTFFSKSSKNFSFTSHLP